MRICYDGAGEPVDLLDECLGHHGARISRGHHRPLLHHDEVIGVSGSLIEVMQNSHKGAPTLAECVQQVQQFVLVGDVQESGGSFRSIRYIFAEYSGDNYP